MAEVRIAMLLGTDAHCVQLSQAVHEACSRERIAHECILYCQSDNLLEDFASGKRYDIYLLDMELPDGEKTARRIRALRNFKQTAIILVAAYRERYRNLRPNGQIDPLCSCEEAVRVLQETVHAARKDLPALRLSIGGRPYRVRCEDILCLWRKTDRMVLTYWDFNQPRRLEYGGVLAHAYEQLPRPEFHMPHRSCIVHFQYVRKLDAAKIHLQDDTVVPVSCFRMADTLRQYRAYRERYALEGNHTI